MILLLSMVIVILLMIIAFQFYLRTKMNKELHQIQKKLSEIIEDGTAEKVLIQTNQQTIRLFLIQINRLLDHNQQVIADYAKTKESLRKMLSNMSHDFRTPLTVILGYVEKLILDQSMRETERTEVIDRLYQKTLSVIALLNKFFDLVKLESGDHVIPLGRLCVNEVCRKIVLDFYDLLKSKNLQVDIKIPEQNLYILGNEDALNRVLNNLISNSIHYGSDGGVFGLTVRENDDYIDIEIWDRGKGISEIHQERVFERLYTLDDARNLAFQGNGLGLTISKRLTEAMRGVIHLSSKPYEKTVFTCRFNRMTY